MSEPPFQDPAFKRENPNLKLRIPRKLIFQRVFIDFKIDEHALIFQYFRLDLKTEYVLDNRLDMIRNNYILANPPLINPKL